MTDEDIQIIAAKYNVGPDIDPDYARTVYYGKRIIENKQDILDALNM